MTALELLTTLHALGVALTPTCDYGDVPSGSAPATRRPLVCGLHVDAPQGVLTDALRVAIRESKAELIDLLDEFGERAGILEFEAHLPRADAEALAWETLLQKEMVCQR